MADANTMKMKTIFVVDDNDVNLTKAKRVLEGHYRVLTIPSAGRMFEIITRIMPALIWTITKRPKR